MSDLSDRELLRLLAGELEASEAERLEGALEEEGALRDRYREWCAVWHSIELPDPAAGRSVLPELRRRLESDGVASLGGRRFAVARRRALAAAALAAGVALGIGLGESTLAAGETTRFEGFAPSLAESYWSGLEVAALSDDDSGTAGTAPEEVR